MVDASGQFLGGCKMRHINGVYLLTLHMRTTINNFEHQILTVDLGSRGQRDRSPDFSFFDNFGAETVRCNANTCKHGSVANYIGTTPNNF